MGCFGGGGLTNEKAYQLGKFARVALRASAIDYNGRFCMSSAAAATNRSFGIDRGLPFPLADGLIDNCVVICPLHGLTYDLTTGCEVANGGAPVTAYPVHADDSGTIQLRTEGKVHV